jgi:peptidyl-prolyl cis-trans isomerase SurA
VALLGICVVLAAPSAAATRIEVVVNDQAITNYAIDQRARLLKLTGVKGNVRSEATEQLIDEVLQRQEAKRANVQISDAQVDESFAEIAQRVKLSPKNFATALSQNGVNPETLKDRLRVQLAWSRVVGNRFRSSKKVTEQDLIATLREKGTDTSKETTQYLLERVVVVIPKSASRAEIASAETTARQLRGRFTSCDSGLDLAKQAKGVVVKQAGRRMANEIPDNVLKLVEATDVGRLSAPDKTKEGLEMYAVCDKQTVRSTEAAIQEVQSEIIGEEGALFSRQYLRNLRKDAVIERR